MTKVNAKVSVFVDGPGKEEIIQRIVDLFKRQVFDGALHEMHLNNNSYNPATALDFRAFGEFLESEQQPKPETIKVRIDGLSGALYEYKADHAMSPKCRIVSISLAPDSDDNADPLPQHAEPEKAPEKGQPASQRPSFGEMFAAIIDAARKTEAERVKREAAHICKPGSITPEGRLLSEHEKANKTLQEFSTQVQTQFKKHTSEDCPHELRCFDHLVQVIAASGLLWTGRPNTLVWSLSINNPVVYYRKM